MSRSRFATIVSSAIVLIALLGACSAESLAEFATERYVESQTDGEVDIDFGNGGFNVSTEEGDFSLNLDGENGALVFDTDEGGGIVNFDAEDGTITYDTDEGSGVVSFDVDEDSEQGSITFDTDDGGGVVNFAVDENAEQGTITYDGDDGQGSFSFGSTDTPDGWPAAVGAPASATQAPVFSQFDDRGNVTLTGTFTHDPAEDFATAMIARFEAAGYTKVYTQEGNGTVVAEFSEGSKDLLVMSFGDGTTNVTIIE